MENTQRFQLILSDAERQEIELIASHYRQSLSGAVRFAVHKVAKEVKIEQRQAKELETA